MKRLPLGAAPILLALAASCERAPSDAQYSSPHRNCLSRSVGLCLP